MNVKRKKKYWVNDTNSVMIFTFSNLCCHPGKFIFMRFAVISRATASADPYQIESNLLATAMFPCEGWNSTKSYKKTYVEEVQVTSNIIQLNATRLVQHSRLCTLKERLSFRYVIFEYFVVGQGRYSFRRHSGMKCKIKE